MEYLLNCDICQKQYKTSPTKFYRSKKNINRNKPRHYCSFQCRMKGLGRKESQLVSCGFCGKERMKTNSDIFATRNHFCSQSCAAKYNNSHKTHGTRRSKLEVWLEEQLLSLFPSLIFHFNRKDAVNSEIDIYIPSLSLAFELNGIFHYEPIYGADKLCQIQNNDQRKFQACLEKGIELCIIDTSQQSYFKPKTAQKYLDIIINIIDKKMVSCPEVESGYPCGNTENFKFSGDTS